MKTRDSHSEVEAGQPVDRRKISDEEAGFVRRDVLHQLASGLVSHLQVVDLASCLAPCHLAGAEDQETVASLVVKRTLEAVTVLAGLNHLVTTGGQHLSLVIAGPAVENPIVLGGEGSVSQHAHCQVSLVLILGNLGRQKSVL